MSANEEGSAADLKPFPKAEEGFRRFVICLPALEEENDWKVEIIIGKMVKVDSVNQYFFASRLERKNIKGWGYTYYRLGKVGPMAGTLIAPPPGEPKVDRFVQVRSEGTLIRYNSKLPVVVHVPEGFEVRYRVWEAGKTQAAKPE